MSTLDGRMKEYEGVADARLTRRLPVLLRLDGKAFHTYTKRLRRPWDERLAQAMWAAAAHVCAQAQGAQIAYVQSDEISILLTDWETHNTEAWFGYRVQKLTSVASSLCAVAFHEAAREHLGLDLPRVLPAFDARVWSLPRHEVCNYFIWRQRDAVRNSIAALGQSLYSPAQLHEKGSAAVQDLIRAKGRNWNDSPTWAKRGACLVRSVSEDDPEPRRPRWRVDLETPTFTQDRDYIERFLTPT